MNLNIAQAAILSGLLVSTNVAFAQSADSSDPFDTSSSTSQVDALGNVTKQEVDELKRVATDYYNEGNCSQAITVLDELARKSNWLANMIGSTLEPFYSASSRDREANIRKVSAFGSLETMSNEYKTIRNYAFAMKGDCLVKMGEQEEAIPVLLKTLDLLTINDDDWWETTRNNLLGILQVEIPE